MHPMEEVDKEVQRIREQQVVLLIVTGVAMLLYFLVVVVLKAQDYARPELPLELVHFSYNDSAYSITELNILLQDRYDATSLIVPDKYYYPLLSLFLFCVSFSFVRGRKSSRKIYSRGMMIGGGGLLVVLLLGTNKLTAPSEQLRLTDDSVVLEMERDTLFIVFDNRVILTQPKKLNIYRFSQIDIENIGASEKEKAIWTGGQRPRYLYDAQLVLKPQYPPEIARVLSTISQH